MASDAALSVEDDYAVIVTVEAEAAEVWVTEELELVAVDATELLLELLVVFAVELLLVLLVVFAVELAPLEVVLLLIVTFTLADGVIPAIVLLAWAKIVISKGTSTHADKEHTSS